MLQKIKEAKDKLEIGPPLRLVGMVWISMIAINFLLKNINEGYGPDLTQHK